MSNSIGKAIEILKEIESEWMRNEGFPSARSRRATAGIAAIEALKSEQQQRGEAVAEVRKKYGDPEPFADRELVELEDIQELPIGTKLYAHPEQARQDSGMPDTTKNLADMRMVDILELGYELHQALSGHTFDARDLARSLCGHPVFVNYLEGLGEDIFRSPREAIFPVKQGIQRDLLAIEQARQDGKQTRSQLPEGIDRVRNAATGEIQARQNGMVLVPVEPTQAMIDAGRRAFNDMAYPSDGFGVLAAHEGRQGEVVYKTMLTAAKEKDHES